MPLQRGIIARGVFSPRRAHADQHCATVFPKISVGRMDIASFWAREENGGTLGALMIRCPVTGREFSTGIETDRHTLELIPETVAQALCPHCGIHHAWSKFDARLHEGGTQVN